MVKLNFTNKKYNEYIFYTLIFAIISASVFFIFIKTGRSFIWYIDGLKQHYVILYDLNTIIKNVFQNGISLFSWNMGLGLDLIGQYSYYIIGDPFAYISLFFPTNYLEYVYQILIILRIYFVGIAFIMYCKYNKKESYNTIIGAMIYTFSGYLLFAAIRHPYFTNPIIMLPLTFLGIDKILKEDKYIWFTVTITILAIMNYYFLYIVTILSVIYAIIKYINEFSKHGIKEFGRKLAKTALHYIIAIMIAAIILLPTIYAFLNSDRMGTSYTYYDMEYYNKILFSQLDTPFWSKTNVATIGILILPIGILNLKNNKENRTTLINIVICIVILLVPFLGSVMNGFSFQSNRWSFAYSFYIAYLVAINLKKDLKYNEKEIFSMLFVFLLYMILALIFNNIANKSVLISLIFMGLLIIVLIFRKYSVNTKKTCKILFLIIVCVNIIFSAWLLYSKSGYRYAEQFLKTSEIDKIYNSYEGKIEKFYQAIDYIKKIDDSFYRIGTPIYGDNNLSIMYDYKGLNTYLSIGNKYISKLSKELLILGNSYNPKNNSLNELDSRTKITTLLGSKYYIIPDGKTSYVPYGYQLIKEYENTKIYENKNALPIGVFYNDYIVREDYEKLTFLEKEQALLETAIIENSSLIDGINIDYDEELTNTIKYTTKNIVFKISPENNYINEKKFCIEFDEIKDCELYLYFDNLEYYSENEYYVNVKYNDIQKQQKIENKIASAYYIKTPQILFNLGYMDNHSGKIEVEFTGNRKIYL